MPILFCDLDNTLIDRAAAYRAWAEDYAARMGRDPLEVEWLVSIDHDGMRAREPLFEEVRSRWGIADPVADLVDRYRREYPAFLRPVDSAVVRRLGRLRRSGWTVAIVTNGPPSQRTKVERCGLLPVVDVVVVSGDLAAPRSHLDGDGMASLRHRGEPPGGPEPGARLSTSTRPRTSVHPAEDVRASG